jgi:hypothetical protein
MNKTETELFERLNRTGHASVQWGLDRGRGGTGKLRPYGVRQHKAARKLIEAGIATPGELSTSRTYVRGYGSHHTILPLTKVT